MKQVTFQPPFQVDPSMQWIADMFDQIALSSAEPEDAQEIAAQITISGAYTETRTLTPATATAADIANFLATFIKDMASRR